MAQPSGICVNGEIENPLLWSILTILRKQPSSWKVHTLAAKLAEQGYLRQFDSAPEKNLFKRNFLIMNALYQLQEMVYPELWLCVDAMNISLSRSMGVSHNGIDMNDPLRQYYLDWSHYDANEGEVRRLLNEFWQTYQHFIGKASTINIDKTKALALFGLDCDASRSEIRRQWKKLAFRWHPDRENGNTERFRVLCEAWNVLRNE